MWKHAHTPTYSPTHTHKFPSNIPFILQCYYFTFLVLHCEHNKIPTVTSHPTASFFVSSFHINETGYSSCWFVQYLLLKVSETKWGGSHRAVCREQLYSACHNFGEHSKLVMATLCYAACHEIGNCTLVTGPCVNYIKQNALDSLLFDFHGCTQECKASQRESNKRLYEESDHVSLSSSSMWCTVNVTLYIPVLTWHTLRCLEAHVESLKRQIFQTKLLNW